MRGEKKKKAKRCARQLFNCSKGLYGSIFLQGVKRAGTARRNVLTPARELQHSRQCRQFKWWVTESAASWEPHQLGFAYCAYTSQPWAAASCLAEAAGRLLPPSSTPFPLPLLQPVRNSSCWFLSRLKEKTQLDDICLPLAKFQTEVYAFKEI